MQAELLKPLNRQDIFYSGSVVHLPEYQSTGDVRSYLASTTMIPQEEDAGERR